MSLIKDIYNRSFYTEFANHALEVYPAFAKDKFLKEVMGNGFSKMEWKERLLHTTHCYRLALPADYPTALKIMLQMIEYLQRQSTGHRLVYMFFPQMIAEYGLSYFDLSTKAFEQVTQFISCEFAVRPFILKDPKAVLKLMQRFTKHRSEHVRRFASEGLRPRLPWGMAIPAFKKDPSDLFPILDSLMMDESLYVRKSVANHLNDISKDHPERLIEFAKMWKGKSVGSDWIIKHALRTLLKSGHSEVFALYDLQSKVFECSNFQVAKKKVRIGEEVSFLGGIQNRSKVTQHLRLEYAIYFQRMDGKVSKKVFKMGERKMGAGEQLAFQKKHSFRVITTRVYYPGKHEVGIIVNGREMGRGVFELVL